MKARLISRVVIRKKSLDGDLSKIYAYRFEHESGEKGVWIEMLFLTQNPVNTTVLRKFKDYYLVKNGISIADGTLHVVLANLCQNHVL